MVGPQPPFFRGYVNSRECIVIGPHVTISAAAPKAVICFTSTLGVAYIATLKGRKFSRVIGGFRKAPRDLGCEMLVDYELMNIFSFNLNFQATVLEHILPNIAGFWITCSLKVYQFLPQNPKLF